MSSYPKVSAVVTTDGETAHVEVSMERALNGFYGCTLEMEIKGKSSRKGDRKAVLELIKERVLWRVKQETGRPDYPAEDVTVLEGDHAKP